MNWLLFRRRVLQILGASGKMYYWGRLDDEVFEDGVSIAICEALGLVGVGLTDEQVTRTAASAAVRFVAKEVTRNRKSVPMWSEKDGGEYLTLDYLTKGSRPTQEERCDASTVMRHIGSLAMAEMIAYGDKGEGGLARIRAEREVREKLGTYHKPN